MDEKQEEILNEEVVETTETATPIKTTQKTRAIKPRARKFSG